MRTGCGPKLVYLQCFLELEQGNLGGRSLESQCCRLTSSSLAVEPTVLQVC